MIEVICKSNQKESSIELKGHANYDVHGKDIVCSAVSTAFVMTANLIEKLNLSYNIIELICEEGNLKLNVNTENEIIKSIMENLVYTIDELHKQYPKYIKYKK